MRRSLLALALAFAPVVATACNAAPTASLELKRPLVLTPVVDPQGALKRVAEAVRADPEAGLDVAEAAVPANDHAPGVHESFATGPEKHVLEDYIRTHPELAPPAGYRFGYQRLRDPEGRSYWRMLCIQQGGHAVRRLAAADLVEGPDGGRPQIRARFGPDDARAFGELTAQNLGRRVAFVQDDEVLMAPVVLAPFAGDVVDIDLGAVQTRGEAESALDQLLGR